MRTLDLIFQRFSRLGAATAVAVRRSLLVTALLGSSLAFAIDPQEQPVNINTADAQTLAAALNGIGLRRAEAIVAYRSQHGPFKDAYELTVIKGIGDKVVARNESRIRLSE